MAKVKGGVFGEYSGKLGPAVFYMFRGQQCVRTMPQGIKRGFSKNPNVKAAQEKMACVGKLCSTLRELVKWGMANDDNKRYRCNFIKLNYKNIVQSDRQSPTTFDFDGLQLTNGKLKFDFSYSLDPSELHIHWKNPSPRARLCGGRVGVAVRNVENGEIVTQVCQIDSEVCHIDTRKLKCGETGRLQIFAFAANGKHKSTTTRMDVTLGARPIVATPADSDYLRAYSQLMDIRALLAVTAAATSLLACNEPASETPIYKDSSRPAAERAADLLSRLSVEQKAALMMDRSPALDSLGVPAFHWWSEALHGVGRNGLATMFPQCIGLAASFDTALVLNIYTATSDEARAKNTQARHSGLPLQRMQGLSFWTPNVNIFRDPRWGRGQETYGEDPFLSAAMGRAVVRGLQGDPDAPYRKLLACAKHFAVHSGPEKTRHQLDLRDLPQRDLQETYLPAFRSLVQDAGVAEVMCAYQRLDGQPCCGNTALLRDILRQQWGFRGVVVSDCGAIRDFYAPGCHEVQSDATGASAQAVAAGTDIECGSEYRHIPEAVRDGRLPEAQLDTSLLRLLTLRFQLGDFDPDELNPYTAIPPSVISSPTHRELARQAARESIVLLTNNGILPLDPGDQSVAIMGPNAADSLVMWGIYYGTPAHTVTALEGIRATLPGASYSQGCGLTTPTVSESTFALITDEQGRPGLHATYWNSHDCAGEPAAQLNYTSPLSLDNGGNTPFAQGVNSENFALRLTGTLHPEADETLRITYAHDQWLTLVVGGDTVHNRGHDYAKTNTHDIAVRRGHDVTLELLYKQPRGTASLSLNITRERHTTPQEAVALAGDARTVIFVGGISPIYEREEAKTPVEGFDNGDRTTMELPRAQRELIAALHKAGKKVVLVNCSGSAVALQPETDNCDAIVQLWYAGEQGGNALADVLFGRYNPSGRLPITFYASDRDLPPFDDYLMQTPPGRTYRYFTGKPLFPFGHGLSYTTFQYANLAYHPDTQQLTVDVTNTGDRAGDHVVLAYVKDPTDQRGPTKSLRAFTRLTLQPGQTTTATMTLNDRNLALYDEATQTMRPKKVTYTVQVGELTTQVEP